MPNHTNTILEIRGNKKEIQAFLDTIKTGKKVEHDWLDKEVDEYDFDLLLPIPEELESTISPTSIVTEEEYLKAVKEAKDATDEEKINNVCLPITQAMSDELKKKFGHDNWYNWRNANYGTKWGMYEVVFGGFVTHDTATFTYQTAWSPATAYFVNVSVRFPSLSFRHMFADEGGGFLGYEVISNGEIVEATEFEWYSEKGIALRQELGCYYDDEEGETVGLLESTGK